MNAVAQTIMSRIVLVIPAMVLPPLIMDSLEKNLFKQLPWTKTPMNLGIIGLFIGIGIPLGFGVFPQTGTLRVSDLETKFHNMTNEKGEKIETVYYNKGL